MEFLKKWYTYLKMKHEKHDYDEIYYNKVFNRHMYRKKCDICGYDIYMFELEEFKTHQIECYKFNYIYQRQVKFNS